MHLLKPLEKERSFSTVSFSNLEQLYRQVIMDHYKNPRNKGLLQQDGYHEVHLKIQPVEMTSQFKLKLKMENHRSTS